MTLHPAKKQTTLQSQAQGIQDMSSGLQKTDFLPVQTDFYFVKPIQFA